MERENKGGLETEVFSDNNSSKRSGKVITHLLLATTMIPSAATAYVLASCIGTKIFVETVYNITYCFQGGF